MAGLTQEFPLPNSSFFNIYNDGPITSAATSPTLVGGACNFVDLNGTNGPKCGCRRFWSRGSSARPDRGSPTGYSPGFFSDAAASSDSAAFCMCSHHACYHDDIREAPAPAAPSIVAGFPNTGQENERPRTNREPLTPVLPEMSFAMPPPSGQPTDIFTPYSNKVASFSAHLPTDPNAPPGEVVAPTPQESLPDTLSWTNFIQSQPDQGHKLPPIPSQCLIPSQPSSTTSSVRMGYLKPFAGKGLQTLSGVKSKLREPLVEKDEDEMPVDEEAGEPSAGQSVDELATVTNTPRSSRVTEVTERNTQTTALGVDRETFQELSSTVQGHDQRLDRLENVSFTAAGHDECHDKHDQADLRVTEVEYRVTEIEKLLNDSGSHAGSSRRVLDTASSVASVSTDRSGYVDRAELYSELQSLKAQLSQLQGISSFTSYTNPWEVEVVFLPFPLKGVWVETREFNSQHAPGGSLVDADQWTQLPNSSSSLEPQSPGFGEWTGPEFESDWMLPRACAPNRMIDRRLRSRGLVKTIKVRGPDARSVQNAVSEAFGTLFRTFSRMQGNVYHGSTTHQRVHKFLGLQHPWVPLRKMHKDSRLRFLSPAEMVTPVSWDVQFLTSSVVMKATGVHRLFITQPEAYLQDLDAYDNGWSWQRLRELSRVYPDSQTSQEVPEADALEDCWQWNDRLDDQSTSDNSSQSLSIRQAPPSRLRTVSFSPAPQVAVYAAAPHYSSLSISSAQRRRSGSPHITASGRVESRKTPRPPRIRTTSMPPNLPHLLASPAQVQRRLAASYAHPQAQAPPPSSYQRHSSPQVSVRPATITLAATTAHAHAMATLTKRRRSTRSPSVVDVIRLRNTPRWSTASPSPGPEAMMNAGGGGGGGGAGRATTPYYATPYSNAPFVEGRQNRGGVIIYDDGDFDGDERGSGSGSGSGMDMFYDDGDGDGDGGVDEDGEEGELSSEYHDDSPMLDLAQHQHDVQLQLIHEQQQQQQQQQQHPHDSALGGESGSSSWQDGRPEDEPWPGIEDAENRDPEQDHQALVDLDLGLGLGLGSSGGFDDIDIHVDEDAMSDIDGDVDVDCDDASDGSSAPSEYPSTRRAWTTVAGEEVFKVFEDGTGGSGSGK